MGVLVEESCGEMLLPLPSPLDFSVQGRKEESHESVGRKRLLRSGCLL